MSFKKILMTASALALLGGSAFADGGPVPEQPPAPPPEPAPPPPEPAPAPPPPPAEEPFNHWYIGGHGGAVWADDFLFDPPIGFPVISADMDVGWGAGGALGYRWETGWRTELEATWRRNDGDMFHSFFIGGPFDVEVESLSVMLNVLYDFHVDALFVPYLGAGLGASDVSMESDDLAIDDDDWGFAYQFLGGFSIPFPNTPVELFMDYRYMGTTGFGLGPFEEEDEYRTQNVMGGLRVYF